MLFYPRQPTPEGLAIARKVLRCRFVVSATDINAVLRLARESALDAGHCYYGESSRHARLVADYVADDNLRSATDQQLARKASSIKAKIEGSVSRSMSRINPASIGGSGAAGRQRDHMRDSEGRNILRRELTRIENELKSRGLCP